MAKISYCHDIFWHSFVSDSARESLFKKTLVSFCHISIIQEYFLTWDRKGIQVTYFPIPEISHFSYEANPFHWRIVFTIWAPSAKLLLLVFCCIWVFSVAQARIYMHIFISFSLSLCSWKSWVHTNTSLQFQPSITFHICNFLSTTENPASTPIILNI